MSFGSFVFQPVPFEEAAAREAAEKAARVSRNSKT